VLWKYTEEPTDWWVNAQAWRTDDFPATVQPLDAPQPLSDLMPDAVEVHSGFYSQFASLATVTDPAEGLAGSLLGRALTEASGGQRPLYISISGFSLGAALSELTGVWAAFAFPEASVTVVTQASKCTHCHERSCRISTPSRLLSLLSTLSCRVVRKSAMM
jgi:hypothetical protein